MTKTSYSMEGTRIEKKPTDNNGQTDIRHERENQGRGSQKPRVNLDHHWVAFCLNPLLTPVSIVILYYLFICLIEVYLDFLRWRFLGWNVCLIWILWNYSAGPCAVTPWTSWSILKVTYFCIFWGRVR